MNTRILFSSLVISTLMFASTASAQVGVGIKAGVNLATIDGFNDANASATQRTGVVFGGHMTFGLSPMFAFQPEVLFSMQGTKLHFTAGGVSSDATTKVDYVQVPLLLRLGNSSKDHASVYAVAGPSLGFLVRASQGDIDIKDNLKSTDVGIVTGVGVSVTRLQFEARYTWGLMDLNKTESGGSKQNRVLSFLVGLVF